MKEICVTSVQTPVLSLNSASVSPVEVEAACSKSCGATAATKLPKVLSESDVYFPCLRVLHSTSPVTAGTAARPASTDDVIGSWGSSASVRPPNVLVCQLGQFLP